MTARPLFFDGLRRLHKVFFLSKTTPTSEMTYIVSGGALNSTHSLTPKQLN